MLNEHADRLARIETGIEHILDKVSELTQNFTKRADDHEERLRDIEKSTATKADLSKAHQRIDEQEKKQWKTWVALTALSCGAGGGASIIAKAIF